MWFGRYRTLPQRVGARDFYVFLLVFGVYLGGAKLGQYIFIPLHSAPSVFWLPVGIALAAVFLGGYRAAFPIALAQLVAIGTVGHASWALITVTTAAATLQPVIGAYLLNRFGFTGEMGTAYDAFLLIFGGVFIGLISPGMVGSLAAVLHISAPLLWAEWGRMWAANAFSIFTITPLITSWRSRDAGLSSRQLLELILSYVILVACFYLIFWTKLDESLGLASVCAVWAALFWVAIRFTPRFMCMALALAAGIAVAGGIIAHPATTLNNQLLGDELIFLLFMPIFLIFSSVAHERRKGARDLAREVAQLGILTRQLSADDERKNQFIATLAHELRNPLAPIVSALELLAIRHEADPESREIIKDAQRQAASMRRLLDDLLDASRISRNKLTLLKKKVNLQDIAEHSIKSAEPFLHERRHELLVSLPRKPLWLNADPVRLEQILINLLNNAAKYTKPGGRIELSCRAYGERVRISLRDNGEGIAASDLPEIFMPFRQTGRAPHRRGGLGIGLAITKQLVELHGGTITAASAGVGKGSVFTLSFPLSAGEPSVVEEQKAPKGDLPRRSILVVDDNHSAAEGIGKLLAHRGHQVFIAHTGAQALALVERYAPEAVLLDIGLPDHDGYEVARTLRDRERTPRVLLIAITGYGQKEDKQKAEAAGFDVHLTKPVGIEEIERALAEAGSGRMFA